MRINPREQILELWKSYAIAVRPEAKDYLWGGGAEPNSISDAEQLLVLLYPATEIVDFALDRPDNTQEEAAKAIASLGNKVTIPRLVLDLLWDFLERNTDKATGQPTFGALSYAVPDDETPIVPEQTSFEYVESYSISLTLCLAAAGFTKAFSASVTRPEIRERIVAVDHAIRKRLTAAMVGLLRSFTLNAVSPGAQRDNLLAMISPGQPAGVEVLDRLHRRLEPVRAQLPELTIGVAQEVEHFDDPEQLFELGWTWGVADDAPQVEDLDESLGLEQPAGYAASRPSLYFTSIALDGLADLFSDRTLRLGLITGDQQRLVRALELRFNLTQQYWSTLARFGDEQWPLENVPWLTTDGQESVYNSLLIFSILRRDRISRRITDDDLTRAVAVLEELAIRGRVTRRLTRDDDSVRLYTPGVRIPLVGSDARGGPGLSWYATDFAANLGKRAVEAATLSGQPATRERLITVAEAAMDNVWKRRIKEGPNEGLWDDLSGAFPGIAAPVRLASWTMTERVMEFLVAASAAYVRTPLRTPRLYGIALDLLVEADHKLGREQQLSSGDRGALGEKLLQVQSDIRHARRLAPLEPGTACSILYECLRQLESLRKARNDVTRSR